MTLPLLLRPRRSDGFIEAIVAIVGVGLFLLLLVLMLVFASQNQRIRGENVAGSDASQAASALSNCSTIPADWQTALAQSSGSSGASAALIAAVFAAGEHRYYPNAWPAYTPLPPYPSELNPEVHDRASNGYVRGPAQFKEGTFAPHAPPGSLASRFGTGFLVDPYIEQTVAALTGMGKELQKLVGIAQSRDRLAGDGALMAAIVRYHDGAGADLPKNPESHFYVAKVWPAFVEYRTCESSSGGATPTGRVPLYKQGDPRWGDVSYGCGNSTIRSSGCGPTAAAMVLTYYGHPVTPDQIAQIALDGGFRVCGSGTAHSFFPFIAKRYGLNNDNGISWTSVMNHLRAGRPVIVSGRGPAPYTGGGHYIVLVGINGDGSIAVNDSAGGPERNRSYPESHIRSYHHFATVIYQ